jgi:hypothetical protein
MMNSQTCLLLLAAAAVGCSRGGPPKVIPPLPPPVPTPLQTRIGPNVYLEIDGDRRRVIVPAEVGFREGPLELLFCRRNTKEHESILSADVDARHLHAALLAAGAVPGSPVQFEPKYQPAKGTPVRVLIRHTAGGETKTVNAREWVRESKSQKELLLDWVFAGSFFFKTPPDEKGEQRELYAANGGDIVCVSNFPEAMLDLPVESPAENDALQYEAFTERIPPLGTKLTLIFEPIVPDHEKK